MKLSLTLVSLKTLYQRNKIARATASSYKDRTKERGASAAPDMRPERTRSISA
jgi:hypothetical protein